MARGGALETTLRGDRNRHTAFSRLLNIASLCGFQCYGEVIHHSSTAHLSIHPPLIHQSIHHSFINSSTIHSSTHPPFIHQLIHHSFINPSITHSSTHPPFIHQLIHHSFINSSTTHPSIHPSRSNLQNSEHVALHIVLGLAHEYILFSDRVPLSWSG